VRISNEPPWPPLAPSVSEKAVMAVTGKRIRAGIDFIIADASGVGACEESAEAEARSLRRMACRRREWPSGVRPALRRRPMTVRERSIYERDLSKMHSAP
jgi:hypothetical protein